MEEDKRQRFQGKCLEASEGWLYMDDFDMMPPPVRERLRMSDFNLCPACIGWLGDNHASYELRIKRMEDMIRAGS